jgi:hypothetical protein
VCRVALQRARLTRWCFRLAKALPLNMRADFAWGRDDSTFSLSIGEAF